QRDGGVPQSGSLGRHRVSGLVSTLLPAGRGLSLRCCKANVSFRSGNKASGMETSSRTRRPSACNFKPATKLRERRSAKVSCLVRAQNPAGMSQREPISISSRWPFERQPEKKEASHEGHGSQDHIRRPDGARVDRRRYACLRASFSRPGKERGLSERRLRHSALELLSGDPPPRFCGARLCLRSVL